MVNFPLSSKFSFSSTTASSSSSTPSRSQINHRLPSCPAPKSPPTTALSVLGDLSNCSESFTLARRPAKRPKTSEGYTSFSDLLSIPPSVLDYETNKSEQERKQRQQDLEEGKPVAPETPWTAPPSPDPYFYPYRASSRISHSRSRSDPSPTSSIYDEASTTPRVSPTRPCFSRTQTDPGTATPPADSNGGSRRSSTGSP
ncbi:hypothetical protein JCM16303_004912 [Sporobolomyces ruberrimus]